MPARDFKTYYLANREKLIARARDWALANPERRREIARQSRLKHVNRSREANRKKMRKGWLPGEHERAEACRPVAGYRCPICGGHKPDWVADHHAASGLFREWLCRPCNMALGLLKERPDRLQAALAYLIKHPHGRF